MRGVFYDTNQLCASLLYISYGIMLNYMQNSANIITRRNIYDQRGLLYELHDFIDYSRTGVMDENTRNFAIAEQSILTGGTVTLDDRLYSMLLERQVLHDTQKGVIFEVVSTSDSASEDNDTNFDSTHKQQTETTRVSDLFVDPWIFFM